MGRQSSHSQTSVHMGVDRGDKHGACARSRGKAQQLVALSDTGCKQKAACIPAHHLRVLFITYPEQG
jgi:hypothetical protein